MMYNDNILFMRKCIILLSVLFCAFSSTAQIETSSKNQNDSVSSYIATLIEDIDMRILKYEIKNRYKFYPNIVLNNF